MKYKLILLRCWIWAAMHSPNFRYCELRFEQPIISINVTGASKYHAELLAVRASIARPSIFFYIPFQVFEEFRQAMKLQGEDIPYDALDDIPF